MALQHLKKYKLSAPMAVLVVVLLSVGAWRAKAYTLWYTEDLTQSGWPWALQSQGLLWNVVGYLNQNRGGVFSYTDGRGGNCGAAWASGSPGEISVNVKWDSSMSWGQGAILWGGDSSSEAYPYDVQNAGIYYEIDYTWNGGTYAGVNVIYNFGGTQTYVNGGGFVPNASTGDTIALLTNGSTVGIYVDGKLLFSFTPSGYGGGYYGVGTCNDDANSAITSISAGPTGGSPNAIPASQIGVSAFSNAVDLQWPAATETDPQVGILEYQIYRNNALLATTTSLSYSDTTVNPYTAYTYTLSVVDQFFNAANTNFNVSTPPVGPPQVKSLPPYPSTTPDGRRVGVRPTGAYWGASGENIDMLSGNCEFPVSVRDCG